MEIKTLMKIKKLSNLATIPTKGSDDAAGYDLYAATSDVIEIYPHSTVKVPTDLAMEIPKGCFGGIFARSGLATKKGLAPANKVGVVDADYRGNVIVALHNDTDEIMEIEPKERIAQLVILPYISVNFEEVLELDNTDRGSNGFGSTGNR